MTYDPNSPRNGRERNGMSGGTMAALAIAGVLALGGLFYAMSDNNRSTSGNTTTGQGRTNVTPGAGQNVPNPTPPAAPQSK